MARPCLLLHGPTASGKRERIRGDILTSLLLFLPSHPIGTDRQKDHFNRDIFVTEVAAT